MFKCRYRYQYKKVCSSAGTGTSTKKVCSSAGTGTSTKKGVQLQVPVQLVGTYVQVQLPRYRYIRYVYVNCLATYKGI